MENISSFLPYPQGLFSGAFGEILGKATLYPMFYVLLALSVSKDWDAVVVTTESIPWSEKLAVRVGMAGVCFGKRCICHVKFKGSPFPL